MSRKTIIEYIQNRKFTLKIKKRRNFLRFSMVQLEAFGVQQAIIRLSPRGKMLMFDISYHQPNTYFAGIVQSISNPALNKSSPSHKNSSFSTNRITSPENFPKISKDFQSMSKKLC